jgi:hypothetical protein
MSLPTELANDYTNPADEVPDSAFTPEADTAFDTDPLTDATAGAASGGGVSVGVLIGVGVAAVAVVGGIMMFAK